MASFIFTLQALNKHFGSIDSNRKSLHSLISKTIR